MAAISGVVSAVQRKRANSLKERIGRARADSSVHPESIDELNESSDEIARTYESLRRKQYSRNGRPELSRNESDSISGISASHISMPKWDPFAEPTVAAPPEPIPDLVLHQPGNDQLPLHVRQMLNELNDLDALKTRRRDVEKKLGHLSVADRAMQNARTATHVKKSNEFYKEVRRIARRLQRREEAAFRAKMYQSYNPIKETELTRVHAADELPEIAETRPRLSKMDTYAVRNVQRRVGLQVRRKQLNEWTLSQMIPAATHHLTTILNYIEQYRRRPTAPNAARLRLRDVQLSYVPYEITELPHLVELDMSRNFISTIPLTIGALTNLRLLDLSDNQLRSLPDEIGALSKLQELKLAANYIKSEALPMSLANIVNLRILLLEGNVLDSLPPQIGTFVALETLNLENNALHELGELSELHLLRELLLDANLLRTLPSDLGRLLSLQVLSISHNELECLPDEIGQLVNLEKLVLAENDLKCLPDTIGQMRSLRYLDVSCNYLTTLPPSVGSLQNLESLHIDMNYWLTMPATILNLPKTIAMDPDDRAQAGAAATLHPLNSYTLDDWLRDFVETTIPDIYGQLPVSYINDEEMIATGLASLPPPSRKGRPLPKDRYRDRAVYGKKLVSYKVILEVRQTQYLYESSSRALPSLGKRFSLSLEAP